MKHIEEVSDWVMLPIALIISVIVAWIFSFFMPIGENFPPVYQYYNWHKYQTD